jgi:hypothetical protein
VERQQRTVHVRLWGQMPALPALVLFFATGVLLMLGLLAGALLFTTPAHSMDIPAPVPQPLSGPALPPSPDAPGLWWFAGEAVGIDGSGPGIWRRERLGEEWEWSPLPQTAIGQRTHRATGRPPVPVWPPDPTIIRVERVIHPSGQEIGYWIWNAAAFTQLPSGSHMWSPRWEWAPTGTPVLVHSGEE